MSITVRFAPSPTGLLHVGNVRTALVCWLDARKSQGQFLLRIDDTDQERSEERFVEAIRRDLTWLGLDWDRFERQSDRTAQYDAAIDRLKGDGRLYACYETPEELGLKRKSQLNRGLPPIYDRAALALTDAQKQDFEAQGRRPHWRFKLEHAPIAWDDLVRGAVSFQGADLSDPVLIREDGRPLYHLCSVLDDIDFGVSHVVRGEDHVANTAAHVQMFEALGATPPRFAHLALIADAEGKGLSKRLGSLSIQSLREDSGLEPMAIVSLLARLGTSDPIEPLLDLAPLVDSFDYAKFARATPRFDEEELGRLNARILHGLPYGRVADRLGAGIDEPIWLAVRANLSRLSEARDWARVVSEPMAPVIAEEDRDFLAQAAAVLPEEPWDRDTWGRWTGAVKQASGRKGKRLFMPLRRALTGRDHGPELADLLPLLGRARVTGRLNGTLA